MTNCKLHEILNIGPVLFKKNRGSKHIRISIGPRTKVLVTLPYYCSYAQAIEFVEEKKEWIQKQIILLTSEELKSKEFISRNRDTYITDPQEKLITRLDYLAAKMNIKYKKASVKRQKTIWGSCSQDNNISLNEKLVFLPSYLMDYVIIHELIHVLHKSHGPEFKKELSLAVGDLRPFEKELRNFRYLLYQ